jgi:hypothetical protein
LALQHRADQLLLQLYLQVPVVPAVIPQRQKLLQWVQLPSLIAVS